MTKKVRKTVVAKGKLGPQKKVAAKPTTSRTHADNTRDWKQERDKPARSASGRSSNPTATAPTVASKVDVQELLRSLNFSQDNLVAAAAEQPGLLLQAAQYRVDVMRARVQARTDLDTLRAQEKLNARKEFEREEKKVTEGYIDETVRTNRAVIVLRQQTHDLEVLEEFARLLLSAFYTRQTCLRIVADLTGSERAAERAFASQTEGLQRVRRQVREKYRQVSAGAADDFENEQRTEDD